VKASFLSGRKACGLVHKDEDLLASAQVMGRLGQDQADLGRICEVMSEPGAN
jgi:hypothetical protein